MVAFLDDGTIAAWVMFLYDATRRAKLGELQVPSAVSLWVSLLTGTPLEQRLRSAVRYRRTLDSHRYDLPKYETTRHPEIDAFETSSRGNRVLSARSVEERESTGCSRGR